MQVITNHSLIVLLLKWNNPTGKVLMKIVLKAIELAPKEAELYVKRGIIEAALQKANEAIHDFDKALEIDLKTPTHCITEGISNFKVLN
jgi:tetratricopeptide (TPR) repeat protein